MHFVITSDDNCCTSTQLMAIVNKNVIKVGCKCIKSFAALQNIVPKMLSTLSGKWIISFVRFLVIDVIIENLAQFTLFVTVIHNECEQALKSLYKLIFFFTIEN